MSYAPVNNILALRGCKCYIKDILEDQSIMDMMDDVCINQNPCKLINFFPSSDKDPVVWFFYETNGEPHEEIPDAIKNKYPLVRVFFSSIDYDEWNFAYYKEFGVDGEYNFGTRDEETIDKIFDEFVSK